jgi:hypothetical protein
VLDDDVVKVLAEKRRDYGRLHKVPRYRRRVEPRTCAALEKPQSAKLALELEKLRHDDTHGVAATSYTSVGSISTTGGGSVDVAVKSGGGTLVEAPPRWDSGTTAGTMNSLETRNSANDKHYAALLRRLDAQAARYHAGCMSSLLDKLDWLLPPPGNDEPSWKQTLWRAPPARGR